MQQSDNTGGRVHSALRAPKSKTHSRALLVPSNEATTSSTHLANTISKDADAIRTDADQTASATSSEGQRAARSLGPSAADSGKRGKPSSSLPRLARRSDPCAFASYSSRYPKSPLVRRNAQQTFANKVLDAREASCAPSSHQTLRTGQGPNQDELAILVGQPGTAAALDRADVLDGDSASMGPGAISRTGHAPSLSLHERPSRPSRASLDDRKYRPPTPQESRSSFALPVTISNESRRRLSPCARTPSLGLRSLDNLVGANDNHIELKEAFSTSQYSKSATDKISSLRTLLPTLEADTVLLKRDLAESATPRASKDRTPTSAVQSNQAVLTMRSAVFGHKKTTSKGFDTDCKLVRARDTDGTHARVSGLVANTSSIDSDASTTGVLWPRAPLLVASRTDTHVGGSTRRHDDPQGLIPEAWQLSQPQSRPSPLSWSQRLQKGDAATGLHKNSSSVSKPQHLAEAFDLHGARQMGKSAMTVPVDCHNAVPVSEPPSSPQDRMTAGASPVSKFRALPRLASAKKGSQVRANPLMGMPMSPVYLGGHSSVAPAARPAHSQRTLSHGAEISFATQAGQTTFDHLNSTALHPSRSLTDLRETASAIYAVGGSQSQQGTLWTPLSVRRDWPRSAATSDAVARYLKYGHDQPYNPAQSALWSSLRPGNVSRGAYSESSIIENIDEEASDVVEMQKIFPHFKNDKLWYRQGPRHLKDGPHAAHGGGRSVSVDDLDKLGLRPPLETRTQRDTSSLDQRRRRQMTFDSLCMDAPNKSEYVRQRTQTFAAGESAVANIINMDAKHIRNFSALLNTHESAAKAATYVPLEGSCQPVASPQDAPKIVMRAPHFGQMERSAPEIALSATSIDSGLYKPSNEVSKALALSHMQEISPSQANPGHSPSRLHIAIAGISRPWSFASEGSASSASDMYFSPNTTNDDLALSPEADGSPQACSDEPPHGHATYQRPVGEAQQPHFERSQTPASALAACLQDRACGVPPHDSISRDPINRATVDESHIANRCVSSSSAQSGETATNSTSGGAKYRFEVVNSPAGSRKSVLEEQEKAQPEEPDNEVFPTLDSLPELYELSSVAGSDVSSVEDLSEDEKCDTLHRNSTRCRDSNGPTLESFELLDSFAALSCGDSNLRTMAIAGTSAQALRPKIARFHTVPSAQEHASQVLLQDLEVDLCPEDFEIVPVLDNETNSTRLELRWRLRLTLPGSNVSLREVKGGTTLSSAALERLQSLRTDVDSQLPRANASQLDSIHKHAPKGDQPHSLPTIETPRQTLQTLSSASDSLDSDLTRTASLVQTIAKDLRAGEGRGFAFRPYGQVRHASPSTLKQHFDRSTPATLGGPKFSPRPLLLAPNGRHPGANSPRRSESPLPRLTSHRLLDTASSGQQVPTFAVHAEAMAPASAEGKGLRRIRKLRPPPLILASSFGATGHGRVGRAHHNRSSRDVSPRHITPSGIMPYHYSDIEGARRLLKPLTPAGTSSCPNSALMPCLEREKPRHISGQRHSASYLMDAQELADDRSPGLVEDQASIADTSSSDTMDMELTDKHPPADLLFQTSSSLAHITGARQ
ncbi:hypothetical protein IE81DRAFT_190111 [Ceraceosorus guamensis]|uniref:Uncharacterized protein n=1 Tax=Ceraceosorus guamensis TaxID=1522189 RepID=A0A316W613_9BASI|nr:hypothetical protein IE81DRAFT_190111 [Ceraceosorus guamensis]PWN45400.1 hypothetical protein IE81DRAFT_190111 [Ceraceosorus guamensis]